MNIYLFVCIQFCDNIQLKQSSNLISVDRLCYSTLKVISCQNDWLFSWNWAERLTKASKIIFFKWFKEFCCIYNDHQLHQLVWTGSKYETREILLFERWFFRWNIRFDCKFLRFYCENLNENENNHNFRIVGSLMLTQSVVFMKI